MINIRFVLLPLLLFNFCDKAHKSKDIKEGMSIERLSRIDIMLNKAIDSKEIPGAVALVKRNGKTVYQKSFGIANPDNNRTISENDIFIIRFMLLHLFAFVLLLWFFC